MLKYVKQQISDLVSEINVAKLRQAFKLKGHKSTRHMVFVGNPGLASRFKTTIAFDDYSNGELLDIFPSLLKDHDYHLDKEAKKTIKEVFNKVKTINGNGRSIRNMFEDTIKLQARRVNRLDDISIDCLSEIKACDLALAQIQA